MTASEKVAAGKDNRMRYNTGRVVIIGKNAKVLQQIDNRLRKAIDGFISLSHSEVAAFDNRPGDKVWILSFSRKPEENRQMFEEFRRWKGARFHYISTATANVADITDCYEYPRIKRLAELDAQSIVNAIIVRIGVVYEDVGQLPSGNTACTHVNEIVAALANKMPSISLEKNFVHLYELKEKPFSSSLENLCFRIYGKLLSIVRSRPCILRPIDLVMRALGWHWYGYLYLSNRLCLSKT